jgi:hypothetical protein
MKDIELIKKVIYILEKSEIQGDLGDYWRTVYIDEPEYIQILKDLHTLFSELNKE